jgi:hypothetical protein
MRSSIKKSDNPGCHNRAYNFSLIQYLMLQSIDNAERAAEEFRVASNKSNIKLRSLGNSVEKESLTDAFPTQSLGLDTVVNPNDLSYVYINNGLPSLFEPGF